MAQIMWEAASEFAPKGCIPQTNSTREGGTLASRTQQSAHIDYNTLMQEPQMQEEPLITAPAPINTTPPHKQQSPLRYENSKQNEQSLQSLVPREIGTLTPSQLYTLRSQILLYKHLVRNMPLPPNLTPQPLSSELWLVERERLIEESAKYYRDKVERQVQLKNMILSKLAQKKESTAEDRYNTEKVDLYLDRRKADLVKVLERTDFSNQQTKLKFQNEYKFLMLKDFYFKLRDKLAQGLLQTNKTRIFERQLLDRSYFKRERPQRNREAGTRAQKLQNQMKSDRERKRKLKHKQFIQQLYQHHAEFFEFHKKKMKILKKRVTQAKIQFQSIESKREKNLNEAQQLRIKLIKENNIEEYWNLIKKTKNTKIEELLHQTNNFLKELGAKVLIQKGQNPNALEDTELKDKDSDFEYNLINANKIYYNLTHTISQQITKQPSLLLGGQLKIYQLVGLQWLVSLYNNNLNGILADEMGLGKTIQTISLFAYLIEHKKNYGPFLIVVPLTTIPNWTIQFDKWAPSIKKIVYKGTQQARNDLAKKLKSTRWNVCITTYDFIIKDRNKLNKFSWQYIVIDEGHRMKNSKSKFALVLTEQYHSNHRLLLTGTPLQNNLQQLWSLINFLNPKVFNNCEDFEKWFYMPIAKTTGSAQSVQLTEEQKLLIINRLHQVLRPFLLRRVKKQVESELPDKIQHIIKVQLSSWQRILYGNISNKGANELSNSSRVTTKAVMNLMMQLRKCCNHPYLFLNNYSDLVSNDYIFRSSGKFQLLDRILPKLRAFKHRVLIFSQMTHLMDILQDYFKYRGIPHLRLDGNTKLDDRGQRTNLFNMEDSPYDIFLLSTRAGGLGLNLQSADTVILFDSDWNPQMDLQAQDRAHRIGQKKKVLVLRFITNTEIEEMIMSKAAYKMNLNQIFIQGGLYNLNSSEAERRKKIEDLLKKKSKDQQVEDSDIPNDQLINRFISRSEEEFQTFTKMDEERYEKEESIYPNFVDPRDNIDKDTQKINYRLLGDDEVPDWLIQSQKPEEEVREYGRGNRERRRVSYVDEIGDQQYMEYMEQEYRINEKKKRTEKKEKKEGVVIPEEQVFRQDSSSEVKMKSQSSVVFQQSD